MLDRGASPTFVLVHEGEGGTGHRSRHARAAAGGPGQSRLPRPQLTVQAHEHSALERDSSDVPPLSGQFRFGPLERADVELAHRDRLQLDFLDPVSIAARTSNSSSRRRAARSKSRAWAACFISFSS